MNLSSSIARVAAGDHLVARHGSAVVLVCPRGPEHWPFVDQLLALCAEAGLGDPHVVRRAGALVTQNAPEAVPGFGFLCQTAEGVVALLAGEVALTFTDGLTVETLDGTDASTYVERVLRAEYDELRLAAVGAPAADPRSSLTDGVVRGAGLLLLPGSAVETLIGLPPVDSEVTDLPEPVIESGGTGSTVPLEHTTAVTPGRSGATFESISLVEEAARGGRSRFLQRRLSHRKRPRPPRIRWWMASIAPAATSIRPTRSSVPHVASRWCSRRTIGSWVRGPRWVFS